MFAVYAYYPAARWWLPGAASGLCLLAMAVLPIAALLLSFDVESGTAVLSQAYTWRVVRFTVWQASLSTGISLILAVPMAIALSRRGNFPGRALLLRLFSVPLVIPTLVAITGIVVVFGQSGWLRSALDAAGAGEQYSFYGLPGILLAHVFFNFPLATRVLLQSLDTIPAENWRLVDQFGLRGREQLRRLEWPAIVRTLPGISVLIFGLCFTSFAVVLTLGGGPRASTIEVAIYQALRLDFDIPTAVVLALLQLSICIALLLASNVLGRPTLLGGSDAISVSGRTATRSAWLNVCLFAGFVFVAAPMFAVLVRGLNPQLWSVLTDIAVWRATLLTATIGIAASFVAVLLATGLLLSARHLRLRQNRIRTGRTLASLGLIALVLPGTVISAGLFLLLRDVLDVFANAFWLVILVNSLLGLPFACAVLNDPLHSVAERCDRLCAALGVLGLRRLRRVEWPLLRKPVSLALGLCSALAAGDLTAIALFGNQHLQTLPLLLYQRIGGYRMAEASATALLLLLLCLALFWIFERGLQGNQHAAR